MSQLIWAVCNRPVGFGMDLGCHWRLGRLYGPRIVPSIVRHGDVAGRMLLGTTHAEHHETTGGYCTFPCRSAKTLSAGRVVERSRIIFGCL